MSVEVRLSRHGTRNSPFYHVVACDKRMRRDGGRLLEKLGTYDPRTKESLIELKEDRIRHWYENGAQLSNTVAKLLKIKKIKLERKDNATKKKA